ncbi:MAG: magnesium chelatase, partial [Candidatus Nealsonbacteria bacterium CG23_combo_of_CG06-09_8_20_14_all_36_125]
MGYLLADGKINFSPENKVFVGELALDGRLRPIKGALSFAIACRVKGFAELILPKENAIEAGLIKEVKVIGAENLKEVIDYLQAKKEILPRKTDIKDFLSIPNYPVDLGYI